MVTKKRKIGDLGEKVALKYLIGQGYKLLDKNWQKPWGEIDLIIKGENKEIIFIEVKTINWDILSHIEPFQNGSIMSQLPEENVTSKKKRKLIKTVQTYLLEKNYSDETNYRIDVITIELNLSTKRANLRHIKNAVY